MNVKSFVILFLAFVWLMPVAAQYNFDAIEQERMSTAGVKTQTQWTHDYVDGKPSAKGNRSSVTKYDTKGNIIEVINYNDKGEVISVIVNQYDNRDNKVNFEQYQDNRKKLIQSRKIVYDANGNKTREYGFDGATLYNNTFKYVENGKLSEINYTLENVLVEKRMFTYFGDKTEILIYDQNNNLTFKQENIYNNKGLLVSEKKVGNKGNVVHTLDLQYNAAGDLIEEVRKRADDKLDYQKLYEYDSKNRPIKEETVNLDGTKFVSHEYQYNNQGDLVLETWKKNEKTKEPSSKKIKYNSKGLYTEIECYFATYNLNSLYKYTCETY